MKKIITYTFIALASTLMLLSCIDDKGNYNYEELGSLNVENATEIDSLSTSVEMGLHIEPTIEFSGSEKSNYLYDWLHIVPDVGKVGRYDVESVIQTGDDYILNAALPPAMTKQGNYYVLFKATHKETGLQYTKVYYIRVQNKIQIGYAALSEKQGGFDIDFIGLFNDTLTLYPDLLKTLGSELPREGIKPINIAIYPSDLIAPSSKSSMFIVTDKWTKRLKIEDFSYAEGYDIDKACFIPDRFIPEKGIVPENLVAYPPRGYMQLGGNWFFYNQSLQFYYYSMPINRIYGTQTYFKPSSHIAVTGMYGAMLFDEDNKRFVQQKAATTSGDLANSNAILSCEILADNDGDAYKFNDADYNLKFMEVRHTYKSNFGELQPEGYAVVKHTSTSQAEVLSFTFGAKTAKKIAKYKFPAGFDIDAVKFFSYHTSLPFLYCFTEDKVYLANTISGAETMTVTDITDAVVPAGHKISMAKNMYIRKGVSPLYFVVATYDPSKPIDTCGTIQFFTADEFTGKLNLAEHASTKTDYKVNMRWDGVGKVVAFDWKSK